MEPTLQALQFSVIPWLTDSSKERLIVARPSMNEAELPENATLSPRKITGKRVIFKGERKFANQRMCLAEWPEANLHEIAFPKLACIINGNADYLLGNYSVNCRTGHLILIPARLPHQAKGPFSNHPKGVCTILHAFAYGHGIYLWLSRTQDLQHTNDAPNNYLIPNIEATQLFNLMMEEAIAGKDGHATVCHGLLTAFFTILKRELQDGHYMHPGPRAMHESPIASNPDFAGQMQEYLETNCHKPLKLEEVASHFYMSTSQFTRRIRQETGSTYGELLVKVRIERAKQLLNETDWTFNAISGYLSFRSPSYFLSLFRERTGCTPMEYRRRSIASHTQPESKTTQFQHP